MFPLSNTTYLLCNNPEEYFILTLPIYLQTHSSAKFLFANNAQGQGCSQIQVSQLFTQLLLHPALAPLLLYTVTTSFLKH